MFRDLEGNKIQLIGGNNGHILIEGSSGSGKSFLCSRIIEAEQGENTLTVDYSNTFNKKELVRHGIKEKAFSNIRIIKPYMGNGDSVWTLQFATDEIFVNSMVQVIEKMLQIRSYKQRKALMCICAEYYEQYQNISIQGLIEYIVGILCGKNNNSGYDLKVLDIILCKLDIYKEVNLCFINSVYRNYADKGTHILDLSRYTFYIRQVITQMLLDLIWQETIQLGKSKYSRILFDEIHNLIGKNTTLEIMIREGRRFGLSVILSTQCISTFTKAQQDILNQASTHISFKPTARETNYIAKEIDYDNYRAWSKILNNLERGMAVVRGSYIINDRVKSNIPIVCRVEN